MEYEIVESDVEVSIDDIEIFQINCKQDMIDSIAENGLMVRPKLFKLDEDDDHYLIDDGRRRLSIAKYDLDWDTVRCDIVRTDGILSSLIYNFQRSPNPMMEAIHINELIEEQDYTQKELAHELGCTQSKISKRLKLLELIDELRNRLKRGDLPKSVGYELAKLSEQKQREIADEKDVITLKDVKEEKRKEVVENLDMEQIEEDPQGEPDTTDGEVITVEKPEELAYQDKLMEKHTEVYAQLEFKPHNQITAIDWEGNVREYEKFKSLLEDMYGKVNVKFEEISYLHVWDKENLVTQSNMKDKWKCKICGKVEQTSIGRPNNAGCVGGDTDE